MSSGARINDILELPSAAAELSLAASLVNEGHVMDIQRLTPL